MAGAKATGKKASGRPAAGPSSTSTGSPPATGSTTSGGAPAKQTGQATTTPAGKGGSQSRPAPPKPRTSNRGFGGTAGTAVDHGAGFLLGLAFWVLVGLPFLQGGPTGVRNQLRAKFFNKDSKGNWLP